MNEEEARGWLIAHSMHSELEEIEKVASWWGSLTRAIKATGKRWTEAGKKSGAFKKEMKAAKETGRFRQSPSMLRRGETGIGDYLKFHGGRLMEGNPGAVAGVGIGAGTLGAGKLVFGD